MVYIYAKSPQEYTKMGKEARINAIRRIIEDRSISSQEELAQHLLQEGFQVTQATLSRDLKRIKVGKIPDGQGGYIYSFPQGDPIAGTDQDLIKDFARGFVSIDFTGCFGVIKTLPGHANSVASAIDHLRIGEILGTIAGDDTILVLPRDGIAREHLISGLERLIPGLKEKTI